MIDVKLDIRSVVITDRSRVYIIFVVGDRFFMHNPEKLDKSAGYSLESIKAESTDNIITIGYQFCNWLNQIKRRENDFNWNVVEHKPNKISVREFEQYADGVLGNEGLVLLRRWSEHYNNINHGYFTYSHARKIIEDYFLVKEISHVEQPISLRETVSQFDDGCWVVVDKRKKERHFFIIDGEVFIYDYLRIIYS